MRVAQLIDVLRNYPQELEVELAVIAPPDDEDIEVDRYPVEGLLQWVDDEDGVPTVWLLCGEEDDVDAFLDAVEDAEES